MLTRILFVGRHRELGNLGDKQQHGGLRITHSLSQVVGHIRLGVIRYGSCYAELTYSCRRHNFVKRCEGFDDRAAASWAVSAMHLLLHQVGDEEDGADCRFGKYGTHFRVPDVWCWFRPEGWSSATPGH